VSVGTTTQTVSYTPGVGVTALAVPFPFQAASDLVVTKNGSTLLLGTHYTVAGGGPLAANGTVNLVVGANGTDVYKIVRATSILQPVSLPTQGTFSAATHENEFDRLTEIDQDLAARIAALEASGSTNNAVAGDGLQNVAGTWKVKADPSGNGLGAPNVVVSASGVAVLTEGDEATMNPVLSDAGSPSAGGRATAARGDHQHIATTAAPGNASNGAAIAQGTSPSLARADHAHGFPAPGAPPAVSTDAAAAAAGVSTKFAREDHAHVETTAAPTTISDSTNTQGTATSGVRSDHVHAHGNRGGGTLHAVASSSTAGFMSAADKAKLDLITDFSNLLLTTINGSGQTTDATPNTLATQFVPVNGEGYFVELIAIGTKADGSQAGVYKVLGAYRRVGGVTSLVGALNLLFTAEDDAAWDATLVITANNIRPQVTGKAATTINWQVYLRVYQSP
jgi:hypothetical protein